MKQLDRKPFILWKSEYELSIHYIVERDDEFQQRIFINKIHSGRTGLFHMVRDVIVQFASNISCGFIMRLQKTVVSSRLDCAIRGNIFFFKKILNDVPEGLNIDGRV